MLIPRTNEKSTFPEKEGHSPGEDGFKYAKYSKDIRVNERFCERTIASHVPKESDVKGYR